MLWRCGAECWSWAVFLCVCQVVRALSLSHGSIHSKAGGSTTTCRKLRLACFHVGWFPSRAVDERTQVNACAFVSPLRRQCGSTSSSGSSSARWWSYSGVRSTGPSRWLEGRWGSFSPTRAWRPQRRSPSSTLPQGSSEGRPPRIINENVFWYNLIIWE